MQFWQLIRKDYFLTINVPLKHLIKYLKHLIKYFIEVFHKSNGGRGGSLVTSYERLLLICHSKFENTFKNYSDTYTVNMKSLPIRIKK